MKKNLISYAALAFTALSSLTLSAGLPDKAVYYGSGSAPESKSESVLKSVNARTQRFLESNVRDADHLVLWERLAGCLWQARRAEVSVDVLAQLLESPTAPGDAPLGRLWNSLSALCPDPKVGADLGSGLSLLRSHLARDWTFAALDEVNTKPEFLSEMHQGVVSALGRLRQRLEQAAATPAVDETAATGRPEGEE